MPLNITLDGSYYRDGRIVIMGKPDHAHSIDAALFLTSMRLACESTDPYFSLDPVGSAWNKEGEDATAALWKRIASDFKSQPDIKKKSSIFTIRTISARRDYQKVWASLEGNYPNLKSELVFRPTWLAETRFGEILYKADVLLKELSGGVSVLEPGPLRASKIDNYVSASERSAAEGLLDAYEGKGRSIEPVWRGHRLWFDLTSSQTQSVLEPIKVFDNENGRRAHHDSELHSILGKRYLLPQDASTATRTKVSADGNALDLSAVFPRMFVRMHDHATGKDLSGNEPALDSLSADVNSRTSAYASAYKELNALTEVFRAYVAGVNITQKDKSICAEVKSQSLLNAERVAHQLPRYHPTELFITVAGYEFSTKKYRRLVRNRATSLNGGIAIRARAYLDKALERRPTEITRIVSTEGNATRKEHAWEGDGGYHFVALSVAPPAALQAATPVTGDALDRIRPPQPGTVQPSANPRSNFPKGWNSFPQEDLTEGLYRAERQKYQEELRKLEENSRKFEENSRKFEELSRQIDREAEELNRKAEALKALPVLKPEYHRAARKARKRRSR